MSGPSVRHHSPMTATDSTQTVTVNWVRNWFGPISRLASVSQILEGTVQTVRCTVPPANSESFAWRLAVGIAARKLALRPDLFVTWLGVAAGCFDKATVPPDSFSRMVDRGILVNVGEPGRQAHDSHFYGLIGEAVLHEVLWDGTHGKGAPVIVEGHDWSVTDTGGDQLAIYPNSGDFCFRLWESKGRYGATDIGAVVQGAAEQLGSKAAGYLSRFAIATSRTVSDEGLAAFVAHMPDLWVDNDPRAGVGVGVTTHSVPAAATPFAQLTAHFNLPDSNKGGQLTLLGPLAAYRTTVSKTLWKGVGLWTGP